MITPDTNLGRLLDDHPELVDLLAASHQHFARLRNRLLRRVMAPRVTVGQAAAVAGLPADDLVAVLRRAVGEDIDAREPSSGRGGGSEPPGAAASTDPTSEGGPRPAALAAVRIIELDVRDDLRRGVEPLARIVTAARAIGAGEALAVRAPFEPIPLYDVLGRRGLAHWTERLAEGDWRVWFYRAAAPLGDLTRPTEAAPAHAATEPAPAAATALPALDVRGLEPPLPMVRVLERLDDLAPGATLTVLHERRPMFLYPLLEDRGFAHETDEPEPGLVRIVIRRRQV